MNVVRMDHRDARLCGIVQLGGREREDEGRLCISGLAALQQLKSKTALGFQNVQKAGIEICSASACKTIQRIPRAVLAKRKMILLHSSKRDWRTSNMEWTLSQSKTNRTSE